jgi:hypothetical protein
MYLVDAAGGAEEIRLDPNAQSGDNNIYAFAVTFPRRVAAANEAAKAFQPNARCRAPGEVILAHLDPTSRSVAEYTRVDVDPESLTGIIGALDFDQSAATPPALIAMYMGIYGDSSLYGQVHWNELIAVDPLRVLRRAPQTVSRSGADGVVVGGALVPEGNHDDDVYGFRNEPGPTTRLSLLDLTNPLASARHVLLLAGPNGLASGWALVSQL